jgi:hypothetical protein
MRILCLNLCFLLLLPVFANSQVLDVFGNIDESFASTGLFWNKATITYDPPSPDEYSYPNSSITRELLNISHFASVNLMDAIVPDNTILNAALKQVEQSQGAIPIVIAEQRYNYISQFAVNNNWVFTMNDELIQLPDVDVFDEGNTLILHIEDTEIDAGMNYFYLSSDLYFQNFGGLPDLVEIDFDNGNGFQTVSYDSRIAINYNSFAEYRNVKIRVTREGQVKKAGANLKSNYCTSTYEEPITPPWAVDVDLNFPENLWRIATTVDGELVSGNAYYLPSGLFDKPFIFIEGIDFETNKGALRNGSFGWCQFTSGINLDHYDYSMVHKMPEFLDVLRQHGYDIILLDFGYGAESLDLNGMLLVKLLDLVNQHKIGNEPNIVAGASMGGQVSRFALRYMELNNLDHCTRLWLTLDSPHTGANIPIGIQQILDGLSKEPNGASAREAIDDKLLAPAARQLLRTQYFDISGEAYGDLSSVFNPPIHVAWYDMMNTWGYPENCRRVAVSNGSGFGSGQSQNGLNYDYFDPMFSHECELVGCSDGPEALFFVAPSCGDPWYSDQYGYYSNGTSNISAKIVAKENPTILSTIPTMLPFVFGPIVGITSAVLSQNCFMNPSQHTYWVPHETPNWDYAPGGYRNTIDEVVDGINTAMEGVEVPIVDWGCPIATEYNRFHSFIPTESSLGIQGFDPFTNIFNKIVLGEIIVPFDRYYFPVQNQSHTTLTDENINFMLEEIVSGENPDGTQLLPEIFTSASGEFNYGHVGFNFIRSIDITNSGVVKLNNNQPLHYGEDLTDLPSLHFDMTTLTGCAASEIFISNNGRLIVGDISGITTAQLNLLNGSFIELGGHGTLEINTGSKIIMESGSELRLVGGKLLIYGELIVEEGAKIIFSDGTILLPTGRLVFDGGQLKLTTGANLEFKHLTGHEGFVEILAGTENVLVNGTTSKLSFIGLSQEDLLLKVTDFAHLQNSNFGAGSIEFDHCKVDLTNGGGIWTDMLLKANYTTFISSGADGKIAPWYSGATMVSCILNGVVLNSYWCKVAANHTTIENAKFEALGGGFAFMNSKFEESTCSSVNLQMVSGFTNTVFNYSGATDEIIADESIVEIHMIGCSITGAPDLIGCYKRMGKLSLKCSVFRECGIAVYADKGLYLNLSSSDFAGYNRFVDCDIMIYLDYAIGLDLYAGYNSFSDVGSSIFSGFLTGYGCESDEIENCISQVISAENNVWPDGVVPDYPIINILSEENGNCSGAMQECYVLVEDTNPERDDVACGSKIPIIDFTKNCVNSEIPSSQLLNRLSEKEEIQSNINFFLKDFDPSNPLLNTEYFNNVYLEEALLIAASYSELIDTLGNDSISIQLFYEILTSDLDQSNQEIRWKMDWGLRHMKTAFENLHESEAINTDSLEQSFDEFEQRYVDVLNALTSPVIPDSVYRERFYFEMLKGQFFHTIGNYPMAIEIFDHIDNCQLDSLEQTVVNYWMATSAMALNSQFQYSDGVSFDSITFDLDTTGFVIASPYSADQYYFGALINSPNSVTYVPCSGTRSLFDVANRFNATIFPNPTNDIFHVFYDGNDALCSLIVFSTEGKTVYSSVKYLVNGEQWTHSITDLPAGSYIIQIGNVDGISRHKVQFFK